MPLQAVAAALVQYRGLAELASLLLQNVIALLMQGPLPLDSLLALLHVVSAVCGCLHALPEDVDREPVADATWR